MSPNAGGGLRDLSQQVGTYLQLYTGAQINFGDLTPYLTYGCWLLLELRSPSLRSKKKCLSQKFVFSSDLRIFSIILVVITKTWHWIKIQKKPDSAAA
jgi:hypothetical protein